jgi:hypothetical protein
MATAVITQTVREPTVAEVTQFIFTGDFTSGAGIVVDVTLEILNDADGSRNRKMSFTLDNLSAGQKDHFQGDVVAAMSNIISKIEDLLGVTFA